MDESALLLVASDRVSAFDVVLREPVPSKGAVLTQLSAFWFRLLGGGDATPPDHGGRGRDRQLAPAPRAASRGARGTCHARTPNGAHLVRMCRAWLPVRLGVGRVPALRHAGGRAVAWGTGRESAPRPHPSFLRRRRRRRVTTKTSPTRTWSTRSGATSPAGCVTRVSRCTRRAVGTARNAGSSSPTPSSSSGRAPGGRAVGNR